MRFKEVSYRAQEYGLSHMRWGHEPAESSPEKANSIDLFVGPMGAGKSLLAAYFANMYHRGRVNVEDIGRVPWAVLTNLESPTLPEYGAWAKPLDLSSQVFDVESDIELIVVWIDEIPQYLNSRRGMLKEVIKMINQFTLSRKKRVKLLGTGISIDWIDQRLTSMATRIYNCWTPNKGQTVYADVHEMATGHLPPEKRQRPPRRRFWHTGSVRGTYDTRELVNADSEFAEARTEKVVWVDDVDDFTGFSSVKDIVLRRVTKLVNNGVRTADPRDIAASLRHDASLPVYVGPVGEVLAESGLMRLDDGTFLLRTHKAKEAVPA